MPGESVGALSVSAGCDACLVRWSRGWTAGVAGVICPALVSLTAALHATPVPHTYVAARRRTHGHKSNVCSIVSLGAITTSSTPEAATRPGPTS